MKHTSRTSDRLYRVSIVRYPEGALIPDPHGGYILDRDWKPEGWEASAEYVDATGTSRFIWPSDQRMWWTHKTAKQYAALFERHGAIVEVERTQPIQWETYVEPKKLQYGSKSEGGPSLRERLFACRDEESREVLSERGRRVRELLERWPGDED